MPSECCDKNGPENEMCFVLLGGEIGSMRVDDLLQLRKCPNLLLSIAFWIFNYKRVEWDADSDFWLWDPYISLLVPEEDDQETINDCLQDLYHDERHQEDNESCESEDESSESEGEPVQITNNMTDLSGDPQ